MRDVELHRSKSRLDAVFRQAGGLGASGDQELQAHFSRYLCVLVAGFVEVSVRRIFVRYAGGHSDPNVARFVTEQLKGFQNPKMENIYLLARGFSVDWEADLRTVTAGELKDAIDSVVANRHKIAHGESVGLSLGVLKGYYARVVEVIEVLEERYGP
jgi:hypothetical protein